MFRFSEARVNFHWTGHIYTYIIYIFWWESSFQIPVLCFQLESSPIIPPLLLESLRGVNLACFHFFRRNAVANGLQISFIFIQIVIWSHLILPNTSHTHTNLYETLSTHTFQKGFHDHWMHLNACQNMLQHQVFCFFPMYHCVDSAQRWTHVEIQFSKLPEKLHDAQTFKKTTLKLYGVYDILGTRVLLAWISGRGKSLCQTTCNECETMETLYIPAFLAEWLSKFQMTPWKQLCYCICRTLCARLLKNTAKTRVLQPGQEKCVDSGAFLSILAMHSCTNAMKNKLFCSGNRRMPPMSYKGSKAHVKEI